MKKIFFLFFVSIGLFTACVPNPEEDPDTVAPIGDLQVDFDGAHFTSTTTAVVLDDTSLSIKGTDATGAFFRIGIPEAPIVGTYTLEDVPGLILQYDLGNGSDPYMAAKDDTGPYASFAEYTNTAQLVITNIDRVNKRISGTFKFTGVRYADVLQTAVNTKVFTSGSFYSLPYTATEVVTPTDVLVKKITETDADGTVYTMEFFYTGNKLNYSIDENGIRTNFTYDGDLLMKEERIEGTTVIERTTYEYDTSSKLKTYVDVNLVDDTGTKITYVHNAGTILYQEYSGDSTTQDELGSSGTLTSTTHIENYTDPFTMEMQVFTGTFTFDTKNNYFKNVVGYDKVYFADSDMALNSNNNMLTHTDQIDSDPAYPLETLTYTYNTNDYPTEIVHRDGADELDYTEVITYY
ncbi:DUF6252 family protein [Flavobacterium sp.]|uniref:DUF6252 family protein n=1 Tax=Flavobacterium sp. TaxID=239 RepID=UPI00286C37AC|nr:DUF6252 family protein [Flavobacterium sp.]